MMDAEMLAHLKLHLVPGLGPKTTEALLTRFETAEQILGASVQDLASVPHISRKTAEQLRERISKIDLDQELSALEEHQVRLIHKNHVQFPQALRGMTDSPQFLYCRGALEALEKPSVAIVGSRHCTPYGKRVTRGLVEGLIRAGYAIVSGLARGIDGAAHQATLEFGGSTLAVLAGGLAKIYPPEHRELAEKILERGALLSEMPMRVAPLPELFPRRNRIISGMCRAVVIVEAALRSGALITARLAAEQGREVLAVPGPVDSEASAGTHELIRQGATLIRSADDVLEALGSLPKLQQTDDPRAPSRPHAKQVPTSPPANLSAVQLKIWQALGMEGQMVDDLVTGTELNISEINSGLLLMELGGHIRRLPGNRFARK